MAINSSPSLPIGRAETDIRQQLSKPVLGIATFVILATMVACGDNDPQTPPTNKDTGSQTGMDAGQDTNQADTNEEDPSDATDPIVMDVMSDAGGMDVDVSPDVVEDVPQIQIGMECQTLPSSEGPHKGCIPHIDSHYQELNGEVVCQADRNPEFADYVQGDEAITSLNGTDYQVRLSFDSSVDLVCIDVSKWYTPAEEQADCQTTMAIIPEEAYIGYGLELARNNFKVLHLRWLVRTNDCAIVKLRDSGDDEEDRVINPGELSPIATSENLHISESGEHFSMFSILRFFSTSTLSLEHKLEPNITIEQL